MLPGGEFLPNGGKSSHVRAAYSTASEEQMEEALKRLAALLREERGGTQ
jgi:DNA-binding transcriptional MocR family regulator